MELPPNAPDQQTYKPDPTKTLLDNLYEIYYRRSTATPAEVEWFNANKPEAWSAWESSSDKPAADPAPEQQQQQQQTTPNLIPPTFDVTRYNGFDLAVASDEKANRVIADIAKLNQSLEDAAHATFDAERRRLIDSGVSIDEANTVAKKLADQQQSEQRAALYKKNESRLLAAIQELQAAEKSAADFARVYNCIDRPVSETLLTLHGLGTAERQSYATQLAGANPGALRAAAELARATGNVTLAAATFLENAKWPREQRSFANDQLADAMFAKKAGEIHKSYVATRAAVNSAMLNLRELATGRTTATSNGKISLGLSRMQAGIEPNSEPPLDKPLGDNHNLTKIRAGLDQLAKKA
jgi:hypothetical protein